MKLIKQVYNYFFGDFWNNQYNVTLVEYYFKLFLWFPLAFNS